MSKAIDGAELIHDLEITNVLYNYNDEDEEIREGEQDNNDLLICIFFYGT